MMSKLLTLNKHRSQSLPQRFILHMSNIISLGLNYSSSLPAFNNISESANSNSNKPSKFFHL